MWAISEAVDIYYNAVVKDVGLSQRFCVYLEMSVSPVAQNSFCL